MNLGAGYHGRSLMPVSIDAGLQKQNSVKKQCG